MLRCETSAELMTAPCQPADLVQRLDVAFSGLSFQFDRATAPTIPHRVHTMRGPNDGTGTKLGRIISSRSAATSEPKRVTSLRAPSDRL